MQDIANELLETLRSAERFRWYGLAAAAALLILGFTVVLALPNRYEARAQVYVNTQSVLAPLLQGIAVAPDTGNQAQLVRRAMISRPVLQTVAERTGLTRKTDTAIERDATLRSLEKLIQISLDRELGYYTITYADADPKIAYGVVKALSDTLVSGSTSADQSNSASAQAFLQQQVNEYSKRLAEYDAKLADFKQRNLALMPDTRGDNFARLQAEKSQLERVKSDLAVAQSQRTELRRKIAGSAPSTGTGPIEMPTDSQLQAAASIDGQIAQSTRELEAMLLRFTDKHPDVVALRSTIARLRERRRVEVGSVRATTTGSGGGDGGGAMDAVLQNLQVQLNSTDVQIAALEAQANEITRRIATLQQSVAAAPEVEAAYSSLTRDYDVTRAQYQQLLQRLEIARVSSDVDKDPESKFRIVEPPTVPTKTVGVGRRVLLLAVFVLSIAAGAGLAWALSLLAPVFVAKRQIEKRLGLTVVGAVREFLSEAEEARRRATNLKFGATAAVLGLAVVLSLVLSEPLSRQIRSLIEPGA
ncbi:MAG: XrtA system polysaccharide chain length determinant [Steroidobacteraceae bacterium]